MWGDFETRNHFLESLVLKQQNDLHWKNVEMSRLKEEIRELKYQLEYVSSHCEPKKYCSVLAEPGEVSLPVETEVIRFVKPAASIELSHNNPYDGAYHVVAKIGNPHKGDFKYSYYITKESLLSSRDRVGILTYLHKKVIEELSRQSENLT